MKPTSKFLTVLLLAGAISIVFFLKNQQTASGVRNDGAAVSGVSKSEMAKSSGASAEESAATEARPVTAGGPRLVDLGADKCVPCKAMAPVLEELKTEYAGTFEVEFIDVWKNPGAGQKYGIRVIPTQIFYDADGKELVRHEGFFSKESILTVWKELGVL